MRNIHQKTHTGRFLVVNIDEFDVEQKGFKFLSCTSERRADRISTGGIGM